MSTKRWVEEASDATDLERDVLRSGLREEPPLGAQEDVWHGLSAVVGPLAPAAGASAVSTVGTVKASATLVTLAKGFVVGVGVSAAVAGGARVIAPRAGTAPSASLRAVEHAPSGAEVGRIEVAVPSVSAGSVAAPETTAPSQPSPLPDVSRSSDSPLVPRVAERAAGPALGPTSSVAAFPLADAHAPARQSDLEEETRLLQQARAELRAGALASALATLEASRAKFSSPELFQEREALTIELLYRSGQEAAAAERARQFLRRFSGSPHASRIRVFAGESR
jgi:hypothetical protein